jgi:hypothetical protein
MSLDIPTPPSSDETPDESLEMLRAKLKKQRAAQKACLAKHKRTTFLAVEVAKKGTTFFDPEKLREKLEDEEDVSSDASSD